MEFSKIEEKIFNEVENGKVCAIKEKYNKIKIADGTVIVNNLTIRNVYEIYKIDNTLWINENTINLDNVEDFFFIVSLWIMEVIKWNMILNNQ